MLKTVDVLIGVTTVLLLFSMAVTVITQLLTSLGGRRARHLRNGLSDLLQQLGISTSDCAKEIAGELLRHPVIAEGKWRMGTVIHREEFTKLLLDFATGTGAKKIGDDSRDALKKVLADGGINDPEQTLKNIRALALQLEASNPELSNHMRDGLAILHEASSDFVARVNFWFDQTIDRVSQRFTTYTHWVTFLVAVLVVVTVQLDIIAIADRLWIDDQVRRTVVSDATKRFSSQPPDASVKDNSIAYYNLLNATGLITVPIDHNWAAQLMDARKIPGMLTSILLISLGAPFWYNALKDLLKLRSSLAQNDDAQRAQRQLGSGDSTPAASDSAIVASRPAWLSGERGDLAAVG